MKNNENSRKLLKVVEILLKESYDNAFSERIKAGIAKSKKAKRS